MNTFRPASFFYEKFNLPRKFLRELVERHGVRMSEVLSVDGVNKIKLYCVEEVETALTALGMGGGDGE